MINIVLNERPGVDEEKEGKAAPTIHTETLKSLLEEPLQEAPDPVTIYPKTLNHEGAKSGLSILRTGISRYETVKKELAQLQEKSENSLTEAEKNEKEEYIQIIKNSFEWYNRAQQISNDYKERIKELEKKPVTVEKEGEI